MGTAVVEEVGATDIAVCLGSRKLTTLDNLQEFHRLLAQEQCQW